jgi:hypothetical protein
LSRPYNHDAKLKRENETEKQFFAAVAQASLAVSEHRAFSLYFLPPGDSG